MSYSISSGALGNPDLLLSYCVIALALHNTIILITTLNQLINQLIQVLVTYLDCRLTSDTRNSTGAVLYAMEPLLQLSLAKEDLYGVALSGLRKGLLGGLQVSLKSFRRVIEEGFIELWGLFLVLYTGAVFLVSCGVAY